MNTNSFGCLEATFRAKVLLLPHLRVTCQGWVCGRSYGLVTLNVAQASNSDSDVWPFIFLSEHFFIGTVMFF